MTAYGPYTPVRQAGNYFYTSGQIGVNPETNTAARNVSEQTEQALTNLKAALLIVGVTMDDVVKTTVFLTNMKDFADMNAIYEQAFTAPRPARSTVGVRELPKVADAELLVEIEAVAYKEPS